MHLDMVMDVVCPWCFVGKRHMDLALKARPDSVTSRNYRPYQLSPETPAEGVDRDAYYARKFGNTPEFKASREHLIEVGKRLGIAFNYEDNTKIANTIDCHRLIRWSRNEGMSVQDAVVEGLMRRYFEEAAFIGDHDLLVEVAGEAGMDALLVKDLLNTDSDKDAITQEVDMMRRAGVTGVPCFIFDGREAIVGAQESDMLISALDQLKTHRETQAAQIAQA